MIFTIVCKDLIIFHLLSKLWAHKGGDTVKALHAEARMTSCPSRSILLFSIVMELCPGTWLPHCLHFPASLAVMHGHMGKFLQIECGTNDRRHFYFSFLFLADGTNCDPVSTTQRMGGKASREMTEGEGRNLGFQWPSGVELPATRPSNCYTRKKFTSIYFKPPNYLSSHCHSSLTSP